MKLIIFALALLLYACPCSAEWFFVCRLPNLMVVAPAGVYYSALDGAYVVPDGSPLYLRATPADGRVYDYFTVFDVDAYSETTYRFNDSYVLILPPTWVAYELTNYGYRSAPVEPPPLPAEDDDMTDPQMAQFFTNMSTQTQKLVASNASVTDVVSMAQYAICGFIAALTCAATWKG